MAVLSGLLLASGVLGLIVLANFGVGHRTVRALSFAAAGALCGLVALAGAVEAAAAASSLTHADRAALVKAGAGYLVSGLVAASSLLPAVRRWLAGRLPIDPESPVHALALVLTLLLAGTQLSTQLATDLVAQQAASASPLSPLDLIAQELPFLLAAYLGVGAWIRRSPAAATQRLGLVVPAWWQVMLALAAAGAFFAFSTGADALGARLTPELSREVQAANDRLFGQLGNPAGIATIALAAGICEEVLFRGALVPRLGVLWTSFVFTAVHTQYGLSIDTAAVFVLAIALGLIRRYTNTSTTVIAHVVYNALVGIGVWGPWVLPAIAAEGLLILLLLALLTSSLGRSRRTV